MSLQSNRKERDARLLLYAKAFFDKGNDSIVVVCEDTDVFILALSTLMEFRMCIRKEEDWQERDM